MENGDWLTSFADRVRTLLSREFSSLVVPKNDRTIRQCSQLTRTSIHRESLLLAPATSRSMARNDLRVSTILIMIIILIQIAHEWQEISTTAKQFLGGNSSNNSMSRNTSSSSHPLSIRSDLLSSNSSMLGSFSVWDCYYERFSRL